MALEFGLWAADDPRRAAGCCQPNRGTSLHASHPGTSLTTAVGRQDEPEDPANVSRWKGFRIGTAEVRLTPCRRVADLHHSATAVGMAGPTHASGIDSGNGTGLRTCRETIMNSPSRYRCVSMVLRCASGRRGRVFADDMDTLLVLGEQIEESSKLFRARRTLKSNKSPGCRAFHSDGSSENGALWFERGGCSGCSIHFCGRKVTGTIYRRPAFQLQVRLPGL